MSRGGTARCREQLGCCPRVRTQLEAKGVGPHLWCPSATKFWHWERQLPLFNCKHLPTFGSSVPPHSCLCIGIQKGVKGSLVLPSPPPSDPPVTRYRCDPWWFHSLTSGKFPLVKNEEDLTDGPRGSSWLWDLSTTCLPGLPSQVLCIGSHSAQLTQDLVHHAVPSSLETLC